MTIQSVQKILSLEKKLQEAEQAEKEKAALWQEEQQAEILRRFEEDLATLEEEMVAAREEAVQAAVKKAAGLLEKARKFADLLDGLDDSELLPHLQDIRGFISGKGV